ncbi:MAG: alanine racemase [Xanthomonadales bacterium]|jgi:D-serine deaminase-like pyridoxal phosphate-dependent protein|nr:alanine racemase [Xanthomonadales bacterium]
MIIAEPTLLLDPHRCRKNLCGMLRRAREAGVTLRPHCKTHQSRIVGHWLRNEGVDRITVSSLRMAEYFADDGWEDILVAFPYNPGEADRFSALADRCRLGVLLDNPEAIAGLTGRAGPPLDYYVDIDAGYGRTGIPAASIDRVEALMASAKRVPGLAFRGFYCHPGNTYKHEAVKDRQSILATALGALAQLKRHFSSERPTVLVGDTPGCSGARGFPGADEITPGNFVFYDLFQASLGTCSEDDIAVAMACPVVGRYPERGEIVIHGGSVHFSRDSLDVGGQAVYGKLAAADGAGWRPIQEPLYLTALSQEHGMLRLPRARLDRVRIGDLVHVLPVHSCLTAAAMGAYRSTEDEVIDHLAGALARPRM